MIPKNVWEESKKQAENGVSIDGRYQKIGMVLIILIWAIILKIILD